MSAPPLGLALVGAGAFGSFCLHAFEDVREIEIRAIVDTDPQRAEAYARWYQASAYDRLDPVLSDPAVHIVALNTPPHLHAAQGLAVIEAGKHLFCEKPLALTVAEGQRMIDRARAKGVFLTVNYVMQHNPLWQMAAALRAEKHLGTLRHISLMNHAAGLDLPEDHWFWDATRSGGIWVEHGVHFFDAFAMVAGTSGEILAASAFARNNGAFDRVEALARYGTVGAHFYHAFDQSGATERTTVRLAFSGGYVTLHEWVPTHALIEPHQPPDALQTWIAQTWPDLHISAQAGQLHIETPGVKSDVYRAAIQVGMRQLVAAIQYGDMQRLKVTGQQALDSLRMAVSAAQVTA